MLDWFKTGRIDEFAKLLARDLSRRIPPTTGDKKRITPKQFANVVEEVYARAAKFRRENRLGVYKKAKLGNVFKWELKELGYGDDFIEEITKGLIIRLSGRK